MGLLEKASRLTGTGNPGPVTTGPRTIQTAVRGLRARAEQVRQVGARSENAGIGSDFQTRGSSAQGGVKIHGLRDRAEAMRTTGAAEPSHAKSQMSSPAFSPPSPSPAAGRGLLERADALREKASTVAAPPGAIPESPAREAAAPEPSAREAIGRELSEPDAPVETQDVADRDGPSRGGLLERAEQFREGESFDEYGLPPTGDQATGNTDDDERAALRDFDEFLEREVLPDELTSSAQSPGEQELPEWLYEPSDVAADPARDAHAPGALAEVEDPFGEWEQDAEREAEAQARQLELRGTGGADASDEESLLFEVDEGFTTAPAEAHIASQKKIDHYLSLFDITKEISNIAEFDELWEHILYAIMGQVGAETVCILSSTQRVASGAIFYPVIHSGFELPEGWALKRGDEIYDQMATNQGVRYAEEFLNSLQEPISPMERRILETTRARIVVPLKNMNQMFGIVILGGQVSGDDYTIDDLEFLTLLGEMAAVGVDRVLSRIEFERDTEELRRRNMVHGSMFSLARRASTVKSLDDIYDILTRHLQEDFYAESFSVVLLSPRERRYRIFAGNQISPESIEKFSLGVNSELIATISNLVRVYDLKDFRENREITACYTNDDLGLMQHYWIVPLINMNWLVGFITIHRTRVPWTEFHRELMVTAAEIVSAVFANCIIMSERESLFRDPFSPLEERLRQELDKSIQFQAPVSLVDIRVKNIRRLLEINPGEEVASFLVGLNRSIASFLFETDFMARVGQGRFALILPARGKVEADIFVKKLKAEFKRQRMLPGSPIDVQYAHQIISAPEDTTEAGKMLSIFE